MATEQPKFLMAESPLISIIFVGIPGKTSSLIRRMAFATSATSERIRCRWLLCLELYSLVSRKRDPAIQNNSAAFAFTSLGLGTLQFGDSESRSDRSLL